MTTLSRRRSLVAATVSACVLFPIGSAVAQSLTVTVPLTALITRTPDRCQFATTRAVFGQPALTAPVGIELKVVKDETQGAAFDKTPVRLSLNAEGSALVNLETGDSTESATKKLTDIANKQIVLMAPGSENPLCRDVAFPLLIETPVNPLESHIDFVAGGEVSNAINAGNGATAASGSLGAHHVLYKAPGEKRSHFFDAAEALIGWAFPGKESLRGPTVDVQETRVLISVVGNQDSIGGKGGAAFAQALLSPTTASQGIASSVQLEYSPMHEYGNHRQQFGLLGRFIVNQSTWTPLPTGTNDLVPRRRVQAVPLAVDFRLKWVPINRYSTEDGNRFVLSLDFGYIQRALMGDVAGDTLTLRRALSDSLYQAGCATSAAPCSLYRNRFVGYSTGIQATFRQVTAFADLSCLSCDFPILDSKYEGRRIPSVEGLQPIVGFRFDSPFFSLRGR